MNSHIHSKRLTMFGTCPVSPFLFKFFADEVMEGVLGTLHDVGVELGNGEKLYDLS